MAGVNAPTEIQTCKRCEKSACPSGRCAYCNAVLSSRHEHDHMPVPARAGGVETVPVCINCHDLKDRMQPAAWNAPELLEQLENTPPMVRILVAKLLGDLCVAELKL